MTVVRQSRQIAATPERVWNVLARYGSVDAFSPHVSQSFIINGAPEAGLGADRQCNLSDGKNHVKERVTEWREGSSYSVEIYDGTMPIRDAYSTVSVEETAPGETKATIEIGYTPRLGLLGVALDALLIKPRLNKVAGENLEGLRRYVTEPVDIGVTSS